jgi:UDP-N-acetylglucosamine--N-acetylmuramyl-(pentapeptide) pyrophosphoryl-undecaprenol N-acetylglucosamine transferase
VFTKAGAALAFKQSELTKPLLESKVLNLLNSPLQLQAMAQKAKEVAVIDSAEQLAAKICELVST